MEAQRLTTTESLEIVRLTVGQYHTMLELGVLQEGEPIELLDGLLVRKDRGGNMTVSPQHRLVVNRLLQLSSQLEGSGCHVQLQSPLTIEPSHEPEPDAMIVAGSPEDYAERHPRPTEVFAVIEVSDSSLLRDRTTKLRIYAAARIPQYVIVNLAHRKIEVYEDPDPDEPIYRQVETLEQGSGLALRTGEDQRLDVEVSLFFP